MDYINNNKPMFSEENLIKLSTSLMNKKPIYHPEGDIDVSNRRIVGGDTTSINDFNNVKYKWCVGNNSWYRQGMNNFWIPEEINLSQDVKDYPNLNEYERKAYDRVLSFLTFLDSIQTNNLPNITSYITAPEITLCLTIQTFQEAIHSQAYSYMLDTICDPERRDEIIYMFRTDEHLKKRNKFIGDQYNYFVNLPSVYNFLRVITANYLLEGLYFYSGFMFFYNLARNNKMPGSAQVIRYINRDENTHLLLFRNILFSIFKEEKERFLHMESEEDYGKKIFYMIRNMVEIATIHEREWGKYVIGDNITGLNTSMVENYVNYLGNLRFKELMVGFPDEIKEKCEKDMVIFKGAEECPKNMEWVDAYSDPNMVKTDFFEARPTAYAKIGAVKDDL